jgi:hypothetical protein
MTFNHEIKDKRVVESSFKQFDHYEKFEECQLMEVFPERNFHMLA